MFFLLRSLYFGTERTIAKFLQKENARRSKSVRGVLFRVEEEGKPVRLYAALARATSWR